MPRPLSDGGQRVIADGVKTSEQLAFLQMQRCDEEHGFELSYSLSTEDFTHLLGGGNDLQPWYRPAEWDQGSGSPCTH